MKYIIDENGNKYESLWIAGKAWGVEVGGSTIQRIKKNGKVTLGGRVFSLSDEDVEEKEKAAYQPQAAPEPRHNPVVDKLLERYSQGELESLARGEGIERKKIQFPEIRLTGEHHHFVVISDTHIGSIYSPDKWHEIVAEYVNSCGCEAVLHCGDLVEGLKISRAGTQMYELSEVGFEAQREKAVRLLEKYHKPIYIISGNHDMYFKEFAGANIVHSVADALDNVTHIGDDEGDIEISGVVVRLFHGGDGNSYATSYRLQKLVESITGGRKPNILLAGHVHKFCYIFERHIHAISVPCMQMQTGFMRGRKLAAHTGFLDIQFDVCEQGVCNLSVKLFPFYA